MSNYNFAAHAASDRRKWVVVTISILLIIAVIVTGVLTDWFTNWNKYCLFGHDYDVNGVCTRCGEEKLDDLDKAPDETPSDEQEILKGGSLATVLPGKGVLLRAEKIQTLLAASAFEAQNSWTLTATVNAYADNKTVDWAVEFVNASSEWAEGKNVTDYLTITPTEDGSLTADVKVLKPFGEQIKVVCTARDTTLGIKKAECLFDFVQKITGITFQMPSSISSGNADISYEFQTTDYTVAADLSLSIEDCSVNFSVLKAMESLAQSEHPYDIITASNSIGKGIICPVKVKCVLSDRNKITFQDPTLEEYYVSGDGLSKYFVQFSQQTLEEDINEKPSYIDYLFRYGLNQVADYHFQLTLKYLATYAGSTYSSGTKVVNCKIDAGAISVHVEDITLDEGHIYA